MKDIEDRINYLDVNSHNAAFETYRIWIYSIQNLYKFIWSFRKSKKITAKQYNDYKSMIDYIFLRDQHLYYQQMTI